MNKHTRLAIVIAPILAIVGYIAADMFQEQQAQQNRVYVLEPDGQCDVLNHQCILSIDEFQVSISDTDGITQINTTLPLDRAFLFLVDEQDNATTYPLGMLKSPYYWQNSTPLRTLVAEEKQRYKLRLIAHIKGGQYISEFYTQTFAQYP